MVVTVLTNQRVKRVTCLAAAPMSKLKPGLGGVEEGAAESLTCCGLTAMMQTVRMVYRAVILYVLRNAKCHQR